MPRHQRGKSLFRAAVRVFPQQLQVVIHHSSYTCKPGGKADNPFLGKDHHCQLKSLVVPECRFHKAFWIKAL